MIITRANVAKTIRENNSSSKLRSVIFKPIDYIIFTLIDYIILTIYHYHYYCDSRFLSLLQNNQDFNKVIMGRSMILTVVEVSAFLNFLGFVHPYHKFLHIIHP